MSLKERLKKISDYTEKLSYDEIIKKLEKAAEEGKCSIEIYSDEVLEQDILKLKAEGLQVNFKKGEDFDYWNINWN